MPVIVALMNELPQHDFLKNELLFGYGILGKICS